MLASDLVEVKPEPSHHRVLARTANTAGECVTSLVKPDRAAGLAFLPYPPPPLVLVIDHLLRVRVYGVMKRARLAAGVARFYDVARRVGVLIGHLTERMSQLVCGNQGSLRAAAGSGGTGPAYPPISEGVGNRKGLDVLRVRGDT